MGAGPALADHRPIGPDRQAAKTRVVVEDDLAAGVADQIRKRKLDLGRGPPSGGGPVSGRSPSARVRSASERVVRANLLSSFAMAAQTGSHSHVPLTLIHHADKLGPAVIEP